MKNKIPPPILLLVTGGAMWLVSHSSLALPFSLRYSTAIALMIAISGIVTDLLSIRQFRSVETTVNPLKPENATTLVKEGVFGVSRNPMYVGLLLILTGWGLWLGSYSNIVVLLLFFIAITELQIKPEEAALKSLFGQSYVDYCEEVRRWI